ncbi:SpaA isopeptide-forming pilin-related protein [Alkalicoccobacillus plakortidis]|uniref:SpaA isopeptide-forming pilin-related protein n=1 Tax=Alkalicoccobacillus plakortidis TaxID=444060 RepID=A0ABT0XJ11_9BACI|nr:SpaA isopeptide-forming pilin-related protein [Alkalicoccobacillus plakortidis]MCM2675893.1 SpaA isopeptide-forming pilin-related protein [Alkalicoccobacillus plakortidis]
MFKLLNEKGETVREGLETNAAGYLEITGLAPGKYELEETKAPAHYEKLIESISFEIKPSEKTKVQFETNVKNYLIPGSVLLKKADDKDGTALAGAVFSLYTSDDKELQTELVTDEKGLLEVHDLKPGDYYFVETSAPEHYLASDEKIAFTIERGQVEVELVPVTNTLKPGSVALVKVDEDDESVVLAGAEFKLVDQDDEIIKQDLVTDENGRIVVEDLAPGTYYFVETKAPADYQLDGSKIEVVVEKGQEQSATYTAKNKLITGSVVLEKEDDGSGEKLKDAEFRLETSDGKVIEESLVTDENGRIVVSDLKPGTYQFVEINAPIDYVLNDQPYPFEITKSQDEVRIVKATNTLVPGSVELLKVNKHDSSETLAGAEFSLFDAEDNLLEEKLVTNEEGKLVVEGLAPGSYYFVETKAPTDFVVDATPITFVIKRSEKTTIEKVPVTNELIRGQVSLVKTDSLDSSIVLPGATFELRHENGAIVATEVTNEEGILIFTNVLPGDYVVVEVEAPFGYEPDATPIPVTVERSQDEIPLLAKENTLTPGSFTLTKVDSVDGEVALEGAEFTLFDESGNELQTGLVTDENGQLTIGQLPPGDYQLVETKAPINYVQDATPIIFTIEKGLQTVVEKTFTNTLTPGSVVLVKVDADNPDVTLAGTEFKLVNADRETVHENLVTDEDGRIVVENLVPGTYYFVETKAPEHYVLDDTEYEVIVEKGQDQAFVVTATNTLSNGSVVLEKVDDVDSTVLAGAEFRLETLDGELVAEELTTNENGRITVSDLKPGSYQFIEVVAPVGYDLSDEPYAFEIVKGQEQSLVIQAENTLTPGSFIFTKTDSADATLYLAGAEFALLDKDGAEVQTGLVTDENGQIKIDQLAPGDYQLVETKAPEHYVIDETPILFTIEKDNKLQQKGRWKILWRTVQLS